MLHRKTESSSNDNRDISATAATMISIQPRTVGLATRTTVDWSSVLTVEMNGALSRSR